VKRPAVPIVVAVLAGALVALLLYGVLQRGEDTSIDGAVSQGERPAAPGMDVKLPALDGGGATSLGQLRGKVVVLNFWASWCEPCKAEAPVLEKAQKHFRASGGGTVLGVTYKDFADDSRAFVRAQHITYPSVRDDRLQLAPKYGTTKLPETFVINPAGRIVALSRGQIDDRFLSRAIARAEASRT
jgi:cytochrome c biogenesis protein CcmG, thiol:disulfide interchange protein DsbE